MTDILTWEGARDACSNEFFLVQKHKLQLMKPVVLSVLEEHHCKMSSSSSETAKQWLQKRKLQAQKRQVPGSSSSNINIDEEVPTFFL